MAMMLTAVWAGSRKAMGMADPGLGWGKSDDARHHARSGDRRIRKLQACRGVARRQRTHLLAVDVGRPACGIEGRLPVEGMGGGAMVRSEEHTSELQSLMRSSYAVFCLKKKTSN